MSRRRALALLAVPGLVAAVSACGSSSVSENSTPASTAPISTVAPVTSTPVATQPPVTVPPSSTPATSPVPTTTTPLATAPVATAPLATAPVATVPPVTTPAVTVPPVTVTVTTAGSAPRAPRVRPGVPVASPARYRRDVVMAFSSLQRFATTLQSVDSAAEFRAALRSLRANLQQFDGAIRRLRSYQLASRTLDRQRASLGRQGPPLARTMSDFLDAVRDGNAARARTLAAEIQLRLNIFRRSV